MKNNKILKCLKRKEKSFLHIPVEIPTLFTNNPDEKTKQIFLPEVFHQNFRQFILDKDPDSYVFIKRGIDERHKDQGVIRKYLIFSDDETIKKQFYEFIDDFSKKFKLNLIIE